MCQTMTTIDEDEKEEDQDEILLFEDILDIIFTKLSLKDLHRAARVCTIWRRIAKKEISTRNNIQGLILPVVEDFENSDEYVENNSDSEDVYLQSWHIGDSLKSSPALLLLFLDDANKLSEDPAHSFYITYRMQMVNSSSTKIIVFDTLGVTQDKIEISGENNVGLGISFPSTSRLSISYFCPSVHDRYRGNMNRTKLTELLNRAEDSLSIDEDEHNCFIFFESPHAEPTDNYYLRNKTFTDEFLERLKTRCKPGAYTLFGGYIRNTTLCMNDWSDWVILKINGTAMESWSIVIEETLSQEARREKLLNLKKSVKLKTDSIALAMVPSDQGEAHQERLKKTEVFRDIFPNVPLFGIYDKNYKFGVDSIGFGPELQLEHQNATVYLIITTD